jgi:hypothetical protein
LVVGIDCSLFVAVVGGWGGGRGGNCIGQGLRHTPFSLSGNRGENPKKARDHELERATRCAGHER